jgi:DNA replicative helicase MCM subunit Mcm2 (Cdc46/Mcm family)
MASFEVEWRMSGTAVVEADDVDEAESLVTDALMNFETYHLDEIDVDETEMVETNERDDDA